MNEEVKKKQRYAQKKKQMLNDIECVNSIILSYPFVRQNNFKRFYLFHLHHKHHHTIHEERYIGIWQSILVFDRLNSFFLLNLENSCNSQQNDQQKTKNERDMLEKNHLIS